MKKRNEIGEGKVYRKEGERERGREKRKFLAETKMKW